MVGSEDDKSLIMSIKWPCNVWIRAPGAIISLLVNGVGWGEGGTVNLEHVIKVSRYYVYR